MKAARKKAQAPTQMYVVVNKQGQVFAGMRYGYFRWSNDWKQAKPLYEDNTQKLFQEYSNLELVKEEEIL